MRITPNELVHMIGQLPSDHYYNYIHESTGTLIQLVSVEQPEGPIRIRRFNPTRGQGPTGAKEETISRQMLWRVANALSTGQPVNFDRILGGSYNTRSALEALIAHTSQFYYCYPGRIEVISSSTKVKRGHKHLIWRPDAPHRAGRIQEFNATDIVISELPSASAIYEALTLPAVIVSTPGIDIEIERRHAQMQVALIIIGKQLGSRVWVARNDWAIEYKGQKIAELDGVVTALERERTLSAYNEAVRAALYIDCIWFRNTRFMPAVFEIEDSTGVTSGLSRMKGFQDVGPLIQDTRWVIVAPDEHRDKVIRETAKEQFRSLQTWYFPYSSVEELLSLCQRRQISGVTDEFLNCYMESCFN